jgi:hypothetical protein
VALKQIFEHPLFYYLWIAPHLLLIVVATLMFRKSRHKNFPIFFSYLIFEFLQFCVIFSLYCLRTPFQTYRQVDILLRAGSIALHFAILQELFGSPLANNSALRQVMAPILKWLTVVLILLAAVFIGWTYYGTPGLRLLQGYVSIEAFNIAQCGLLVLVFLWYRYLGVKMSSPVFGIALGLGLVAGSEPLIHVLKDTVTRRSSQIVDYVQMAIFHVAVLVWLYFVPGQKAV